MVNLSPTPGPPVSVAAALARAQFVTAAHRLDQLPADRGVEVAFAGRSNAGKSSAINALTRQSALARISKTPGRTQQLVVFEIDPERRLIDLPGYGYAKVPEKLRTHWRGTLDAYFRERESLEGLLLAMDSRHPLKEFDRVMIEFCRARALPCHVLLTKSDKLSRSEAARTLRAVRDEMLREHPESSVQLFSVPQKLGVDEARAWLGERLQL
jgi:GTP-binding protein